MAQHLRLFIAVPFSDGVKKNVRAVQEDLKSRLNGWRWMGEDTLHLTLKFIGDVTTDFAPRVCQMASDAVVGIAPFEFRLAGLGVFPSLNAPNVLWVGTAGELGPLKMMAERLEQSARQLGLKAENRAFSPHVTLARGKQLSPADIDAVRADVINKKNLDVAKVFVRELITYQSFLSPDGATYHALATAPLTT